MPLSDSGKPQDSLFREGHYMLFGPSEQLSALADRAPNARSQGGLDAYSSR